MTLASDCASAAVRWREYTSCTITARNASLADASVDLETVLDQHLTVSGVGGATKTGAHSVVRRGLVVPGAHSGTPVLKPATSSSYRPLAQYGVAPTKVGDRDLLTYDVPEFVYGVEDVDFAYDPAAPPRAVAGRSLLVGAENADGSAGQPLGGAPTGDLRVVSTLPAAASYTVQVTGALPGSGRIATRTTASTVPGASAAATDIKVVMPTGGWRPWTTPAGAGLGREARRVRPREQRSGPRRTRGSSNFRSWN